MGLRASSSLHMKHQGLQISRNLVNRPCTVSQFINDSPRSSSASFRLTFQTISFPVPPIFVQLTELGRYFLHILPWQVNCGIGEVRRLFVGTCSKKWSSFISAKAT